MQSKYYQGLSVDDMVTRFRKNYLTQTGWLKSAEIKEAVDNNGPVPWYSYPAIEVLNTIVRPDMSIFEYGGGGSTAWWSKRVKKIVSVDHDPDWVSHMRKTIRDGDVFDLVAKNAACDPSHERALAGYFNLGHTQYSTGDPEKDLRRGLLDKEFSAYAAYIMQFPKGTFDIISVDGMARNLTAWIAAQYVSDNGFIIFDNAEREDYATGYEALHRAGFARIDFTGPGPINPYGWTTSIWLKSLDVFKK